MNITSFYFLCSFAIFLAVYYIVPKKIQWPLLLVASIGYFLTTGELWLVLYPIISSTVVYYGAKSIFSADNPQKKKRLLLVSMLAILAFLGVLKYGNFFIFTTERVAKIFVPTVSFKFLELLVPLGISFYTLALLGYLFDVYYEISEPQNNYFKFLLFGMYFPTIISGPILRYREIEHSLYCQHEFDYEKVGFGLQRILWGLFKKLVIAERAAIIANEIFNNYDVYKGVYIFVGAVIFTLQLYTDFSGGIDIVCGVSESLGIPLPENFKTPFFSKNIQEFWRRWHITMGAWLKDYIFYPVLRSNWLQNIQTSIKEKRNKKIAKKITTNIALFILWFAIGFWHGGGWNYIWGVGLLQWIYIMISEWIEEKSKKFKAPQWFKYIQMLRTSLLIVLAFIFFRATSLTEGFEIYKAMFSAWNPEVLIDGSILELGLDIKDIIIAGFSVFVLVCASVAQQKMVIREWVAKRKLPIRWIIYITALMVVILFGQYGPGYDAAEFIYQGF